MQRFVEIAIAVFCLALVHWGFAAAAKRLRKGIGNVVSATVRAPLRLTLTSHSQSKVIQQMQEQRRKEGVPPLENPRLD